MSVGTVVVTYNGEKYVKDCIECLLSTERGVEMLVVVVDNGSNDNTLSILKTFEDSIKVIPLQFNLGFGRANNIGIEYLLQKQLDYFLLLNQDVYVKPHSISTLKETCQAFNNDAVVSPMHLASEEGTLDFGFKGYYNRAKPIEEGIYEASFVNAAAWLLPKELCNMVGLFDPLFDHYGEDMDYANRLRFHKRKLLIAEKSEIIHGREQFESFDKVPQIKRWLHYRVGLLVQLKDINMGFIQVIGRVFSKVLRGLGGCLFGGKSKELKMQWGTLLFLMGKLPAVGRHRKISRTPGAFIK